MGSTTVECVADVTATLRPGSRGRPSSAYAPFHNPPISLNAQCVLSISIAEDLTANVNGIVGPDALSLRPVDLSSEDPDYIVEAPEAYLKLNLGDSAYIQAGRFADPGGNGQTWRPDRQPRVHTSVLYNVMPFVQTGVLGNMSFGRLSLTGFFSGGPDEFFHRPYWGIQLVYNPIQGVRFYANYQGGLWHGNDRGARHSLDAGIHIEPSTSFYAGLYFLYGQEQVRVTRESNSSLENFPWFGAEGVLRVRPRNSDNSLLPISFNLITSFFNGAVRTNIEQHDGGVMNGLPSVSVFQAALGVGIHFSDQVMLRIETQQTVPVGQECISPDACSLQSYAAQLVWTSSPQSYVAIAPE